EQCLFRRVSVFVGGFTVEAVEYLYATLGASTLHVLDGLNSLLDKSLVQSVEYGEDEPRLFLLEAIREYGLECLQLNEGGSPTSAFQLLSSTAREGRFAHKWGRAAQMVGCARERTEQYAGSLTMVTGKKRCGTGLTVERKPVLVLVPAWVSC
ncbi:MAG TPA: hypothetical protein VFA10_01410, partial [Ktedonobacteraceae bacterium]|nr:hypothetical protein [Ktedonobacteraceae bacterium]